MECPLLTVLTAVIVYGNNKRKCQLPCPAISAHEPAGKLSGREQERCVEAATKIAKCRYDTSYANYLINL